MEFFLKRELKASELADLTKKASSALKQVIEKTPEGLRINLRHPSVVGFGENQAVVRIGAKTIDGVKTHFVAKLRLDVLNPGLVISKGSLTHTLMHQQNSRVVEEFGLPVVRHYASNEVFPGLHVTIVPDLTQGGKYQVFEGEGFYYPSLFGKRDFNSEHSKVLASMEKMREADILVPYNHVKKGDEALAFRKSIHLVVDSKTQAVVPVISDIDNVRTKTERHPGLARIAQNIRDLSKQLSMLQKAA